MNKDTMPDIDAVDGDWVEALCLEAPKQANLVPGVLNDRLVAGKLAVHFVEATQAWRLSVNGRSVDPATIRKVR